MRVTQMKKSICLIVLILGMGTMLYAQSDNASALTTRGAEEAAIQLTNPTGVYFGYVTVVATKSGNFNMSWTGEQVIDGPEDIQTPLLEDYSGLTLFGITWNSIECRTTPGDTATCNFKTQAND